MTATTDKADQAARTVRALRLLLGEAELQKVLAEGLDPTVDVDDVRHLGFTEDVEGRRAAARNRSGSAQD